MDGLYRSLREAAPYFPMALHLIASALLPIYTGSHASLSRPSSAAKPKTSRNRSNKKDGADEESGDDSGDSDGDDDDSVTKMEGMAPSDAILFPVLAGCTLTGLYLLIKYVGADLLNKILGLYFKVTALFAVAHMINDMTAVLESYVWPKVYSSGGVIWRVDQRRQMVRPFGQSLRPAQQGSRFQQRSNPLPGHFGSKQYGPAVTRRLWRIRGLLAQSYTIRLHVRSLASLKLTVPLRLIVASILAAGILLYSSLISTPWYLTNLQGFAFSYTALQLLSPTSFTTGSLVLVALFFYDTYFVFYTRIMVGVATKLDVPIKLLFPRPSSDGKPSLAMLGLGDIVLPGIMIGLALRFDHFLHYRKQSKSAPHSADGKDIVEKPSYLPISGKWGWYFWTPAATYAQHTKPVDEAQDTAAKTTDGGNKSNVSKLLPQFQRTYFHVSLLGYVTGMAMTLLIMLVFDHAQPALLYLVPGVLGSIWSTALVKGEISEMWQYTEMIDDDDDEEHDEADGEKKKKKKTPTRTDEGTDRSTGSWLTEFFGSSMFGAEKSEKNAKRLEKNVKRSAQTDGDDDDDEKSGSYSGPNKAMEEEEAEQRKAFFSFSIRPTPPKKRRSGRTAPSGAARLAVPTTTTGEKEGSTSGTPRRSSRRLAKKSSSSLSSPSASHVADDDDDEDVVVVQRADAASFVLDESASASVRKRKRKGKKA